MNETLLRLRPGYVVFERALDNIKSYRGNVVSAGQLMVNRLDGCLRGLCMAHDIPFEDVRATTWRLWALGRGNYGRDEAKIAARSRCEILGINVKNVDEAEAAMICLYGTSIPSLKTLIFK